MTPERRASLILWSQCVFALIFGQFAFSGYTIVGKLGLNSTSPVLFALIREWLSAPLLCLAAAIWERSMPRREHFGQLALLGVTGIWGNQLGFLLGLQYAGGILTSLMQPTIPVITTAIAIALGYEPATPLKIFGILLATFGTMYITIPFGGAGTSGEFSLHGDRFLGLMILIVQCTLVSVYLILQKPLLKKFPHPITVTAGSYVFGALCMLLTAYCYFIYTAVLLGRGAYADWHTSTGVILPLAYSVVISTCITYALNTFANAHVPASLVSSVNALQPIITCILCAVITVPSIHQKITAQELIGGAIILVGLGFVCVNKFLFEEHPHLLPRWMSAVQYTMPWGRARVEPETVVYDRLATDPYGSINQIMTRG